MKKKIVDVGEFRTFLVHLFVISILWVHFKRADEFQECGDAFNNQLSLLEFKLAIKTFCAAYGHEDLTDEQIQEDFQLLHQEGECGGVTFVEICDFCCRFIDKKYAARIVDEAGNHTLTKESLYATNAQATLVDRVMEISNSFPVTNLVPPIEVLKELRDRPRQDELEQIVVVNKSEYDDPTTAALDSVVGEMEKHLQIVQLAELKFTTELALQAQGVVETEKISARSIPNSSRVAGE